MKRKRHSPEFKAQVVKEAVDVGNASTVARRHDHSVSEEAGNLCEMITTTY